VDAVIVVPETVVPANVPPVYAGPENPVPAVNVVPETVEDTARAPENVLVPVVTTSPKLVMVGITS
jgi:hypothetical protein